LLNACLFDNPVQQEQESQQACRNNQRQQQRPVPRKARDNPITDGGRTRPSPVVVAVPVMVMMPVPPER
jgi:hypothetical protein